jgi:hypothetical protein
MAQGGQFGGRRTVVLASKYGQTIHVLVDAAALALPFDIHAHKTQGVVVLAKNLSRPYVNPSTGILWCNATEYAELCVEAGSCSEAGKELHKWTADEPEALNEVALMAEESLQFGGGAR